MQGVGIAKSSLRRPSAEENLAVEQYPHLNERIYASDPPGYFQARLNLLMLRASRAADLDALLVEGVQFDGLRAHIDVSAAIKYDEQAHQAFISAEAEVLLHHASEALLRLYFAHADNAPCSWLEDGRQRAVEPDLPEYEIPALIHTCAPASVRDRGTCAHFLGAALALEPGIHRTAHDRTPSPHGSRTATVALRCPRAPDQRRA